MIQQENNKNQQRYRTMAVFINNCLSLMQEEGIENLSIRKVAKRAGYNSATIYHYFTDFEELIVYACLKYVDEYASDLSQYLSTDMNPMESYINIWKCFCKHSYARPREFSLLFFKHMNDCKDFSKYFSQYYEIFPAAKSKSLAEYTAMLEEGNLYDREFILLSRCLNQAGYNIPDKEIFNICEMNLFIYRGVISILIESPEMITQQDATDKTILFVQKTLKAYLQ